MNTDQLVEAASAVPKPRRYARYGWIIDKDHNPDTSAPEDTVFNAKGLMGPRNIAPDIESALRNSKEGLKFRMVDDDGETSYTGRFMQFAPSSDELLFKPLDDFGTPNAGCTEIQYYEKSGWTCLLTGRSGGTDG